MTISNRLDNNSSKHRDEVSASDKKRWKKFGSKRYENLSSDGTVDLYRTILSSIGRGVASEKYSFDEIIFHNIDLLHHILCDNYRYNIQTLVELFTIVGEKEYAEKHSTDPIIMGARKATDLQYRESATFYALCAANTYGLVLYQVREILKTNPEFAKYPAQWQYDLVIPAINDKLERKKDLGSFIRQFSYLPKL